jgi:apolipoprotein N-acyltransferase
MIQSGAVNSRRPLQISSFIRTAVPTRAEAALVIGSAILTVLSFPNFDLWFLAWLSLAPLLMVIVHARTAAHAFVAAWLWGVLFFYGSCWWLTYPMVHYGQISKWLAYPLLLLPIALVAVFPGICAGFLAQFIQRFGFAAVLVAPLVWVSMEWLRYAVTGQLWNTLGYSQAFHPFFIQSARTGGVYAVTFIIVAANTAAACLLLRKWKFAAVASVFTVSLAMLFSYGSQPSSAIESGEPTAAIIVAVQPNVPMDLSGDSVEMKTLLERHLTMTQAALNDLDGGKAGTYSVGLPRLVVWPESPMNFSYARDARLREVVGAFVRRNHVSLLLNSLEPASSGGDQNSAIMVNEQGEIAARYDKIRLMPFGEYVPLPRWLPGSGSVRGIVGEFTTGS